MKMIKRLLFLFLLGTTSFIGYAQDRANEFNAQVKINSDKIQGTNKQVYTTLQDALTQFINTRKWTDATFGINERIDCTFNIIINEATDNSYKAELQIQASSSGVQLKLCNDFAEFP